MLTLISTLSLKGGQAIVGLLQLAPTNPERAFDLPAIVTNTTASFSSKALDYIIVDAEHGSYSRGEVARMVAIGQGIGLTVIVRVADPDPTLVAIALDSRADGVLVPYCEDPEMIQRCAWKVQLHPLKGKAFEDVLKSEKFPSQKTKDYLQKKNGHRIMIVGIESIAAVNNLENLISNGPIDGVFVGPNDLTTSMGIPDELENKEYLDTLTKIIKVSESYNIPVMVHGFTEERTKKTIDKLKIVAGRVLN